MLKMVNVRREVFHVNPEKSFRTVVLPGSRHPEIFWSKLELFVHSHHQILICFSYIYFLVLWRLIIDTICSMVKSSCLPIVIKGNEAPGLRAKSATISGERKIVKYLVSVFARVTGDSLTVDTFVLRHPPMPDVRCLSASSTSADRCGEVIIPYSQISASITLVLNAMWSSI